MLRSGRSVILDGVFSDVSERREAARIARDAGAGFAGLWLDAPAELLRQRIAGRVNDPSDATGDVVDRQLERGAGDLSGWRIVDASGTRADVLASARALLDRRADSSACPGGNERSPG